MIRQRRLTKEDTYLLTHVSRVTCHVDRSNVTHIMDNGSLVMFTILRLFRERLHTSPTSSSTCSPATRVRWYKPRVTCHDSDHRCRRAAGRPARASLGRADTAAGSSCSGGWSRPCRISRSGDQQKILENIIQYLHNIKHPCLVVLLGKVTGEHIGEAFNVG